MPAKEGGKKMKNEKLAVSKGRSSTPSHKIPEGLAEHGNAFMRMFDDHDERTVERKRHQVPNAKLAVSKATAEGKKRKNITELMATQEASEGAVNAPTSTNAEMDEIFASAGSKASRGKPGAVQGRASSAAGGAAEVVTFVDPSRGRGGAALREQEARERRRFMSCKVSKVHQEAEPGAVLAGAGDELNTDGLVSQSAFKEMQREAEELGATALDKKSRKAYEEQKLRAIGAKVEKGPRIGALIGKGMAKKQEERGARALEEAINAGLVQRKGLGKKKRRLEQASGKPKGMMNDGLGGRFKDGILHVKPMGAPRGVNRKKSLLKGIKM